MTTFDLRVATLNVSGGEKTFEEFPHDTWASRREALEMLIARMDSDLLCLQEVSEHIDADGITHSLMEDISQAGDYNYSFYHYLYTIYFLRFIQYRRRIIKNYHLNNYKLFAR